MNHYINKGNKYLVVIKSTGKVIAKFRLKVAAVNNIHVLKKIYLEELEIIKK